MKKDDVDNRNRKDSWKQNYGGKEEEMRLWGLFLFGVIGATVTTASVIQLRRTLDWVYSQLTRSQSSWKGASGGSSRSSFQEEAWKSYNRKLREDYEEEMERVEHIRQMQKKFNRERNKYKWSYENWRENGSGDYHQHFQRNDWDWNAGTSYQYQRFSYRESLRESINYPLSHHYSVLGLDRLRMKPYTDDEIKLAFRLKAKEHHPDQNLGNREAAEAKFKEIMISYETIKSERKNMNHTY